ncbi:nitroreductase [Labedella populi]|uniref:Nitroreductase n=1 Tax=Labedella populi TaxID=2498850 RepID=A0A3S4BDR4_9MICO|nr:nitroreductase family protein [Labedella populi]RWZ68284.1 nitroreductase [Labedella populi]
MSTTTTSPDRLAETRVPISDVIAGRWSPRSFDTESALDETALVAALEAARWAASANNTQPWRFIVGRRGSDTYRRISENLLGFNAAWASTAAALVVNVAEVETAEGTPLRWAEYDLGQAAATFTLQAQKSGLHTHTMGGFDVDAVRRAFSLEERFVPVTVTAVGPVGSPDALQSEVLRSRETAPRSRNAFEDIVLVDE